jgi:hypothetical protein
MITKHKVIKVEARKRLARVDVINRNTREQESVPTYDDIGWAVILDNNVSLLFPSKPEFNAGDLLECRWRKVNG